MQVARYRAKLTAAGNEGATDNGEADTDAVPYDAGEQVEDVESVEDAEDIEDVENVVMTVNDNDDNLDEPPGITDTNIDGTDI